MTFAERYRTERAHRTFESFDDWARFVMDVDQDADVAVDDLGVNIAFSDGSHHRVASFRRKPNAITL
jgi:hypothetical protein